MIALVPYLNFAGNTREALLYYHGIFGGELTLQTFEDAGMADTPEVKDFIVHGSITAGTWSIMASDCHPSFSPPLSMGNNVNLSFVGSDEEQLRSYFNALSEGGTVVMPLEKQFWGDLYGMCIDRFGINWMVNIG